MSRALELNMKVEGILYIALGMLLHQCYCKSWFGIGIRKTDDQLLLKDVLELRPAGIDEMPMIGFNYSIPEPITFIEVHSDENVLAEVNFNYRSNLIMGALTAINTTKINPTVGINIYGFSAEIQNINTSYILNKDKIYAGRLEPQPEYYDNFEDESKFDEEEITATHQQNSNEIFRDDDENFEDFSSHDKIIELGQRQLGDYLIYEAYQTSLSSTEEPAHHSVAFYYIDSNYITYIRFVIFDILSSYRPPVAEYSFFSPNTLKAVITDNETTNLFVQMFLYGYRQTDLPVSYKPYLIASRINQIESPESSVNRFKMLISPKIYELPSEMAVKTSTQNSTCGPVDDNDECNRINGAAGGSSMNSLMLLTIILLALQKTFPLNM